MLVDSIPENNLSRQEQHHLLNDLLLLYLLLCGFYLMSVGVY